VGGQVVVTGLGAITPVGNDRESTWQALVWNDVGQGLLKPFIFSFAISLIGCFYGLRASGGTQGVGRATTQAMVWASVLIFILDFFLGKIFVSSQGS